ncbi:hypothetical protein [Alkalilacustris brevis]|uniref:hypothetical protein n=1 Tax=Alkalilacustris brevis TaxID=2026338 RepID=UPI000E0DB6E6|nr:hypothetical protein [Alkalilacustris brevis]
MQRCLAAAAAILAIASGSAAFAYEAGKADELLPADLERGEAGYAADCAECHASAARITRRVPGDDDEARAEWLEEFLPEHFAPDAQVRRDIIAYMLAQ